MINRGDFEKSFCVNINWLPKDQGIDRLGERRMYVLCCRVGERRMHLITMLSCGGPSRCFLIETRYFFGHTWLECQTLVASF